MSNRLRRPRYVARRPLMGLSGSNDAFSFDGLKGNQYLFLANQSSTLTLTGSNVDSWADYRGSGAAFTNTGSARPTLSSVDGKPSIAFSGTQQLLGNTAAKDILRAKGGGAINVVFRSTDMNNAQRLVSLGDPAVAFMAGGSVSIADRLFRYVGRTADTDSYTSYRGDGDYGTIDRCIIPDDQVGIYGVHFDYATQGIGVFQGGLTRKIKYGSHDNAFSSATSQDKAGVGVAIGGDGFSTQLLTGDILGIHISDVVLTKAENIQAQIKLAQLCGVSDEVIIKHLIAWTGDSIAASGLCLANNSQRVDIQLWKMLGYKRNIFVYNIGVGGTTAQTGFDEPSANMRPSLVASKFEDAHTKRFIFNQLGTNDFVNTVPGGYTEDTWTTYIFNEVNAGLTAYKAAVPSATIIQGTLAGAINNATRTGQIVAYNAKADNLTDADYVVDIGAMTQFKEDHSNTSNANYYCPDTLHISYLGNRTYAHKVIDSALKYDSILGAEFLAAVDGNLNPNDYSSPVAFYNPDHMSQIILDGSTQVSRMDSRIGSDYLEQTTSANRPAFLVDEVNGKSLIRFDGSTDRIASAANTIAMGGAQTFAIAFRFTGTPAGTIMDGRAGSSGVCALFMNGTTLRFTNGTARDLFTPVADTLHILVIRNDGANSGFIVDDGDFTAISDPGSNSGFGRTFGSLASGSDAAAVAFGLSPINNAALTVAEMEDIRDKMRAHYGQ